MFLHDQHPEISVEAENVSSINLGVSPQKMGRTSKGKGKEPKFIRYNGTLSLHIHKLMHV
jgi:hypothetical protein